MAERTILVDDLTGEENDTILPVEFSFQGKAYIIDLSDQSRAQFLLDIDRYLKAARPNVRPTKRTTLGPTPKLVRAWCQQRGIEVNPKGRIPVDIMDAYLRAHP